MPIFDDEIMRIDFHDADAYMTPRHYILMASRRHPSSYSLDYRQPKCHQNEERTTKLVDTRRAARASAFSYQPPQFILISLPHNDMSHMMHAS